MTIEQQSIILNGKPETVPADMSVAELLRWMGRDPEAGGLAVAVNGKVVRRALWTDSILDEDDQVEVITAQQGG